MREGLCHRQLASLWKWCAAKSACAVIAYEQRQLPSALTPAEVALRLVP